MTPILSSASWLMRNRRARTPATWSACAMRSSPPCVMRTVCAWKRVAGPAPEAWARLVGGSVGAEAVKVLLAMEPGAGMQVAAQSRVLRIERRVPDPDRVRRSLDLVRRDPKKPGDTEWIFAKEIVLLDAL